MGREVEGERVGMGMGSGKGVEGEWEGRLRG